MSPATSARSDFEPPVIGRYEVHEELGRGSTGIVYLARDPLIGRWVALKTLSQEFSPGEKQVASLRRRLLNEAQSAGGLSHPGIVAIYDVVEHGEGRLSIASEYVEGTDLSQRLMEPDPLPLEFAGRVVTEVAEALDYAHSRGVVHRDLKPANILLGKDGSIKVTDFGIASLRDRDLADELRNLGSPNYLAPERIMGQEAEARSDVYALGVVLYEMLTRNPPFSGDSVAELARNIVQEKPAPVDHYRSDIFPEITRLLDRVLAKEPADRHDTAGEMAADFSRALDKRSSHNDTVPTPVIEDLELAEPDPAAAEAETGYEGVAAPEPASEVAPPSPPPASPVTVVAEMPPLPPPPAAVKKKTGLRPLLLLLPVALGLLVAAMAFVGGRLSFDSPAEPAALAAVDPADEQRLEYLRLLAESRRLFAEGDREAAQRLLDQAEKISPAAERIREMRDSARREAEAERTALAEAEALDLLDEARADIEAGRLRSAAGRVTRALELIPEDEEAQRLRDELGRLRAQRLAQERSRQAAAAVPEEPPAPVEEGFRPFTPATPASEPAAVPAGNGDLRIDFYSERPRGVLTVYVGSRQVLNRPFRFFEKKKMLRRKGIAGGFDERAEVPAGDLALRIYLTLPESETQLQTVTGRLPAGSLRTLRVRVDDAGGLTTELH